MCESRRFSAQVALIAGGTGALGRAVTAGFLKEGALAMVTYRHQSEFDTLCQAAGPDLWRLEGSNIDVTDEPAVRRMVAAVVSKHSRLDVLVNAVGGYAAGRAFPRSAQLAGRIEHFCTQASRAKAQRMAATFGLRSPIGTASSI